MGIRGRRRGAIIVSAGALLLAGCSAGSDGPPSRLADAVCTTDQLAVSVRGASGGLNHSGAIVVFQDRGDPCTLRGYPSLAGLAANGHPVVQARPAPGGYLGGLRAGTAAPTVHLTTGQSASALYEGLLAPPSGARPCSPYTELLVTPPGNAHSVRVSSTPPGSLCDLQIHPVVPGTTGMAHTPRAPG